MGVVPQPLALPHLHLHLLVLMSSAIKPAQHVSHALAQHTWTAPMATTAMIPMTHSTILAPMMIAQQAAAVLPLLLAPRLTVLEACLAVMTLAITPPKVMCAVRMDVSLPSIATFRLRSNILF